MLVQKQNQELAEKAEALLARDYPEWNDDCLPGPVDDREVFVACRVFSNSSVGIALVRPTFYGPAFKVNHYVNGKLVREYGLIYNGDDIPLRVMKDFMRYIHNL